jgi:enoyl-[acyl-carrier protein] reductase I
MSSRLPGAAPRRSARSERNWQPLTSTTRPKKFVEPLARELEAPILMPLDVRMPGQMEAVFERITKDWGRIDFVVHSIAFSPKDALQGRVVDVPREGFLTTMEVSCWTLLAWRISLSR